MLKKLLKNTKFRIVIKEFFREYEEKIIDIILFGSVVRGKEFPKDIDILVIYKSNQDFKLNRLLKNLINKIGINVEITSKVYKDLFDPTFIAREALLSEGYSLIQDIFISEGLGYNDFYLFRYDLRNFKKSSRMRFYYSLYGRKKEETGMLKKLNSYKFSERILITPIVEVEKMREYLDRWNIKYVEFPVIIPTRIIKSKIFED